MARSCDMQKRYLLSGLGVIVIIALCLLYPRLRKNDEFPYTGTWALVRPDNSVSSITFHENRACSYDDVKVVGAKRHKWRSKCSYRMEGDSAILISETGVQKYEQEPVHNYTATYTCRLTPLDNGAKLLYQPISASYKASIPGWSHVEKGEKRTWIYTRVRAAAHSSRE